MYVQIQNHSVTAAGIDARLFGNFPSGRMFQICVSVRMTPGLHPEAQFSVFHQKHPGVGGIHHQSRSCEVPGAAGSIEGIGPPQKRIETLNHVPFLGMPPVIIV
jgi:hypothetical protein